MQLCLDVFETMLAQSSFEFERPLTGMEIECNLVDADYQPAMSNQEVLASIADPAYQTELGAYNIEFNVPPRRLPGRAALELEAEVRASLNAAEAKANANGAHIVMIGILPTLMPEHLSAGWMSESTRYQALNDSIFTARGEDILIDIAGPERLSLQTGVDRTRIGVHQHAVAPAGLPRRLRAATGTPRRCWPARSWRWAPTRRTSSATSCGPKPASSCSPRPPTPGPTSSRRRACARGCGSASGGSRRSSTCSRRTSATSRRCCPSCPTRIPSRELADGRTPQLAELRLHNGTIYRWNRPVYDVVDGRPHLRVENRVLPAGPTVVDMMANAAFYYGMLRTLSEEDRPLWTKMSFAAAQHNFLAAAQHGMDARLYWPGLGEVTPDELVLRQLLPMADEGLRRWEVSGDVRDRYLGVIEGRAKTGRNGAAWQVSTVQALQERGMTRPNALAEMLRLYCERMHSNEPVHTWDGPD